MEIVEWMEKHHENVLFSLFPTPNKTVFFYFQRHTHLKHFDFI